ncbi:MULTISPECIES: macro domain-containing protein [unclassified Capnocytophaga]|jgi:Predicted phosphatase homologous to the C-terminal domain of histone macroH2A1|uniref:macro domain-containing protein n=1 Tax=unclassified Capnocytophaga TaxID=2640652 RepID=UPI000202B30F|nr:MULTISPECIES: macro domain-containing protein [unclassified Capnocytophaga]EGD34062.1 appr-1-p processing domain protein [Capnocytophaga sp. oral taxon 338 str. F0234]MEB3004790.1 macro domain-containing protein [Capnocytophaga sp. G2]
MIHYLKADATLAQTEGKIIITHICNDIGAWGKGFVLALSRRWKTPEKQYKDWYKQREGFHLGAVQFVQVTENIWVANIIGQHKIYEEKGLPPIRYNAVKEALQKVAAFAIEKQASIQMPRMGCGLAGGSWENIEPIIEQTLLQNDIEVFVCDI